ncbi:hypothetical protein HDG34_003232 [Paraburkholderia sp. HC6.4b]|uniref:hypothetical protein n=1 Tax=unclassified Paraburkholderia TaxID=2615204 RepID=UPI00160A71B7|nr:MULTISPECIES: hypothetical protein [unclassified Paraburkholderia]MBB5409291.1 hypothetical protein [Paraburkholderia sp. HC6.4b]MBB5451019.1 hypothetical protein [Paraburkholderia sp. Kb1A]
MISNLNTLDTQGSDVSWVRQSFLVPSSSFATGSPDASNRFFTSAALKYVDTRPGGNIAINPPPQFTRHADPKAPSRLNGSNGLGIYYSEAIDDNAQVIHMSFGVPQFNSLTQFFTSFYNSGAGVLARTGRGTTFFYTLGKAAGFVVSLMSWRLLAFHLAGVGLNFLMNKPSSKFYYLKRTMPVYWQIVQTIVNQIAVNLGVIPRAGDAVVGADVTNIPGLGDQYQFDAAGIAQMQAAWPDIFFNGGGIDVYKMSTRARRLEAKQIAMYQAAMDTGALTSQNLASVIQNLFSPGNKLADTGARSFSDYISQWFGTVANAQVKPAGGGDDSAPGTSAPADSTGTTSADTSGASTAVTQTQDNATLDSVTENFSQSQSENAGFFDFLNAELNDGGSFVSFRVNATGAVTDSFQNQTADSEIANKINSMSSQARTTRFDAAGGNLASGGVLGLVGSAVNDALDFASGIAGGMGLSGLAALGGSAFVDIPRHWQSASASLARTSYTVNLVSPYGNPVSQLINLYIPLAMLIAGALPLATGRQSYTAPFICELYDRGRCQIRLGIIDSLSVTRGTGNLGFNNDGRALAIDVTFTVADLSSLVYLPISQGLSTAAAQTGASLGFAVTEGAAAVAGAVGGGAIAGPVGAVAGGAGAAAAALPVAAAVSAAGAALGTVVDTVSNVATSLDNIFDGDNPFTDYMAVLGGLGLADQIYVFRKLKLNLTMQMAQWKSWLSPAHWASFAGDLMPARLISGFFKGIDSNI